MKELSEKFVYACYLLFLVYWVAASFHTKRTVEKRSSWGLAWLWISIVVFFLLLRRGGILSLHPGLLLWQWTPVSALVGDGLVLAGLVLCFWARSALGGNWSASVVFKEGHELVERGPYHYVRHPIYSGFLLMVLGAAIVYGRLAGFVMFLVIATGFWFKSIQEEQLLTAHFPEAYPSYKARVKALIPHVL